jgi:hypothetical protein
VGKDKGTKAALMRQMGEEGAFAPKLPARVGRKPWVLVTQELALEMIERFGRGETLSSLERDHRFPTRQAFHQFVIRDEALAAKWENAKRLHAEVLMEQTGPIADREVLAPDGRHDTGAVQRDKLRIEQRHLRAAALDPQRWGRKSETTLVGDVARPLVVREPLMPAEVAREMLRHLAEAERELGLPVLDSAPPAERLRNLKLTGLPLPPPIYALEHQRVDNDERGRDTNPNQDRR